MARLKQDDRIFRVDTPLGKDVLVLDGFSGTEGVSVPFGYALDLLSEEEAIDPADVLRKGMTVTVRLHEGERHIHGLVRRFVQLGQDDELTRYRAEMVPWLWFLGLSHDCRIFQERSVKEIVGGVFDELGYSDYEFRLQGTKYGTREYCVQYRESHLNFVTRLLEEEGMFYFFEHAEGKHVLVVTDDNGGTEPCPGQDVARVSTDEKVWREEDVVRRVQVESAVHIGSVTLRDFDFTRPSLNLQSNASGDGVEEVYDYPGRYLELSDGDRYAQILLEEGQHQGRMVRGEGNCRSFRSGYTFELEEHYRSDANQPYLLLHVSHRAKAGDYRSRQSAPEYANEFLAMPLKIPYRPPLRSMKPRIHGSQTAVVVGPGGEEIYTDSFGRVKVQFHWDRLGKGDEKSSCWVRVSYPWAGKGWGAVHIPRIGQEVILEFLEGDPDRPMVTGRVYNAEQTVPYALPDNQSQSGVKSESTPDGGGFNEIRMEDKKGEEHFYVQAEKDKQVLVKNDRSETVGNDETIDIGNDQTISVGNDRTENVGNNETVGIGKSRDLSVGENESVSVGKNQSVSVGESQDVSIGKDRSISVGKELNESVGGGQTVDVGKDLKESVGGKHTETVSKEFSLKAKKIQVVGDDEISLKAGSATLVLKKNGDVTINGKKITIKGSGDVIVKGSKVAQN